MRRAALCALLLLIACDGKPVPSGTPSPTETDAALLGLDTWIMNADGSNQHDGVAMRGTELNPSWSPDGTMIAFESRRPGDFDIYVATPDSSAEPVRITQSSGDERHPSWSADGTQIVYTSYRAGADKGDLYVIGRDGRNEKRITSLPNSESTPSWSPDGTMIAFAYGSGSKYEIYVCRADGGATRAVTKRGKQSLGPAWSPDGKRLAFYDRDLQEVFVTGVDGSGLVQITAEEGDDELPSWAPSDRILYTRGKQGNHDIWSMAPDGGQKKQLTNNPNDEFGGASSRDGRIAYSRNRTL